MVVVRIIVVTMIVAIDHNNVLTKPCKPTAGSRVDAVLVFGLGQERPKPLPDPEIETKQSLLSRITLYYIAADTGMDGNHYIVLFLLVSLSWQLSLQT